MYQSNDYLWKQMPLIWHQFPFRGKRNEPGLYRYTEEEIKLNFGIFRQKKWLPKHRDKYAPGLFGLSEHGYR